MTGSDEISEQPMSSSKWMSLTNKRALHYSWGWSSCCGEGDRLSYGLPRQTYWTRSVSDLNPASIGQIVSIHASDWRRGRHSSAEVQHPTTPGINSDTCWKYLKCKKFMLKVRYYCIALPLFCFPPRSASSHPESCHATVLASSFLAFSNDRIKTNRIFRIQESPDFAHPYHHSS